MGTGPIHTLSQLLGKTDMAHSTTKLRDLAFSNVSLSKPHHRGCDRWRHDMRLRIEQGGFSTSLKEGLEEDCRKT